MDKSLIYDPHFNGFEKQLGVHPTIVAWIDEVILRGQFHPFAQKKEEPKRPLNAKNSIRSVENHPKNEEEEETKATYVPPVKQAFVEPHRPPLEKPKLFDAFKDIFK